MTGKGGDLFSFCALLEALVTVGGAGWVAATGLFLWVVYGEGRGVGWGSWKLRMGMDVPTNFRIFITRLVGIVEYPRGGGVPLF